MGLIFSVPMREDQVADKIKSETDKAVLNDIRGTVTLESAERQAADIEIQSEMTLLRSSLDDEILARGESELEIRRDFLAAMNSETSLRESGDTALNTALTSTVANFTSSLEDEKTARISGDTAVIQAVENEFNPKIANLTSGLANEVSLSAQRDSAMYAELTASIAAVNSSQGGGVASLKSALDNEVSTRKSQTDSLGSALAKEVADRQTAVTGIRTAISNAVANEASVRSSADSALQNSLASAQSNLNTAISNEASARSTADAALQNSLASAQSNLNTAISNEASVRSSADSALQSAIVSTQNNLNTALTNEATARAAADSALQSSISSAVTTIQDSLKPFTASTTVAAGKAGFVPAPPKLNSSDEVLVLTNKGFQTLADTSIIISAIPSQGVIPNYTGSSITPQWSNYENQKLTISGETSGVDAKTYTAKFKPIGLYHWADGTQSEKTVTWKINPQVAQIPSASNTTFTFDGAAKTLSVTNPNSNASSQTGTVSATNAGNYTATYKLKSTTNYVWSDGTTTDKSIAWKINPQSVQIPSASTTSFTFDGAAKTLSVTNPNSNASSQTGTVSATNAGNYTATYKLKSTTNYVWSDGTTTDKSISWVINVLKLAKPTASTVTFTYDGENKSPSISNFNATYENKTGTDTAKAAASYSITFSLKSTTNTTWADGSTGNVVINWTINKVQVTIPTAAVTTFDFTNKEITLNVNNPDSGYINQSGTTKASAVGTYTVTFTLKDTANYVWKDSTNTAKSISWEIKQVTFSKPTASVTTFTYNQNSQGPVISNYDATFMNKTGTDTAVAVGTYSVTFALKDKNNHKWSDGTTADVVISWRINVLLLEKPTADVTSFEYNETLRTLPVTNYNSNYEDESGTTIAIDAGSYSVTYSLKDTTNTKWVGNSAVAVKISWTITRKPLTEAQSSFYTAATDNLVTWDGAEHSLAELMRSTVDNSLIYNAKYYDFQAPSGSALTNIEPASYATNVFLNPNYSWANGTYVGKRVEWRIKKATIPKPTAAVTSFEYTGAAITLPVDGFNAALMERFDNYVYSAQKVGNYTAAYKLNEATTAHYTWEDGTLSNVYIKWSITKKEIEVPIIDGATSFVYTSKTISPNVINYSPAWMTQSGTTSAIDVGSYRVTYALSDTANTTFKDITANQVTYSWTITKKALTEAQSTGFAQAKALTYNGEPQTVTITNYDPTVHVLDNHITETNANNKYGALIRPANNYTWADGSEGYKTIIWSIGKKQVTIPSFLGASAFVYDGSTKSPQFQNFNTDEVKIYSGTTEAVEKGNYKITLRLTNNSNYEWTDGTTRYKIYSWSITAKLLTKPTRTDTASFTYDGNAKTITVGNYDSSTMIFSGTLSEINAGNYSATYSIKDLTNYAWADGSTADVVISWSIARQNLSAELSNWYFTETTHEYDGSGWRIEPFLASEDLTARDKITFTGPWYVENAGVYNYTIIPNNNYLWNDGTATSINLQYTITKYLIEKVHFSSESVFEYDGTAKSVTITPHFGYTNRDGYAVNSAYSRKYNTSGVVSATNVGNYTVTASLSNPSNAIWDDGTTDDITLAWEIKQGDGLSEPYLKTPTIQWTGNNVSPSIGNYDSNLMTQSGTTTASALGSYSITYTLKDKNNYKWADGTTNDVTLTWQIVRQRMTEAQSTPYATSEYTYNGAEKNGLTLLSTYNASAVTISGTTKATNAGTYIITLTPNSTYAWSDGSTAAKNVSWTIAPMTLAKPRTSGVTMFMYDGNSKSPVVVDYNSTYENQTGAASAVQVGTHTITYSLKSKQNTTWTDGTTADVNLTWTINVLKLAKPNIKNTSFIYDGTEKSPTFNNYDDTYENFSGTDTAVNAGTYSVTISLKDSTNTKWSDNTSVDLTFNWAINKATPALTLSANSIALDNTNSTVTVAVTYTGDGTLTATGANSSPQIVSATCDSNNVTIRGTNFGTDTVTISASSSTNYNAPSPKTISIDSKFFGALEDTSFEGIQYAARNKAARVWHVGDSKVVHLTGWAQKRSVRIMILGFDHNSAIEGDNSIHFAVLGNTGNPTKRYGFLLCKDGGLTTDSRHLSETDAVNGSYAKDVYTYSKIRKFLSASSGGFLDVFPDDLKSVMKAIDKYYSKASTGTNAHVTTYDDTREYEMMVAKMPGTKMWLIGAGEIVYRHTTAHLCNKQLSNYQACYDYFIGGNISKFEQAAMRIGPNYTVETTAISFNEFSNKTQQILTRDMVYYGTYKTNGKVQFCKCATIDLTRNPNNTDNHADVEGMVIPCFAIG